MLVHHRQRPTTLECHTSQTRLPRLSLFTTRDGITRPADKLLDVLTPHWSLALGSSAEVRPVTLTATAIRAAWYQDLQST